MTDSTPQTSWTIKMADGSEVFIPGDILEQASAELDVSFSTPRDLYRPLEDLGLDSLDAVEFVMLLEERLGIDISDEEAWGRDGGLRRPLDFFLIASVRAAIEAEEKGGSDGE